jgi:hypothetical protein
MQRPPLIPPPSSQPRTIDAHCPKTPHSPAIRPTSRPVPLMTRNVHQPLPSSSHAPSSQPLRLLPPSLKFPLRPSHQRAKRERQSQKQEAEPGPSRSGSNGHDAGKSTTSPDRVTANARGVAVDPAQQAPAERPQQKALPLPLPPSTVHRIAWRFLRHEPQYPRELRHRREQRNFGTPKFEAGPQTNPSASSSPHFFAFIPPPTPAHQPTPLHTAEVLREI